MKDEMVLNQQEWDALVMPGYEGASGDGDMMQCLARVPALLQRGKEILSRVAFSESDFMTFKKEVTALRQESQAINTRLRDRLEPTSMDLLPIALYPYLHAHYLSIYGISLATTIIISCILGRLENDHDAFRLHQESSHHAENILHLAEIAIQYQPLGSAVMILCLSAAWLGASNPATREQVKGLLVDYQSACLGISDMEPVAQLEQLERRFTLQ